VGSSCWKKGKEKEKRREGGGAGRCWAGGGYYPSHGAVRAGAVLLGGWAEIGLVIPNSLFFLSFFYSFMKLKLFYCFFYKFSFRAPK
jgi:hypothetical protein